MQVLWDFRDWKIPHMDTHLGLPGILSGVNDETPQIAVGVEFYPGLMALNFRKIAKVRRDDLCKSTMNMDLEVQIHFL